jgi:hypothetical protein
MELIRSVDSIAARSGRTDGFPALNRTAVGMIACGPMSASAKFLLSRS